MGNFGGMGGGSGGNSGASGGGVPAQERREKPSLD
jgi:hypothetical protein